MPAREPSLVVGRFQRAADRLGQRADKERGDQEQGDGNVTAPDWQGADGKRNNEMNDAPMVEIPKRGRPIGSKAKPVRRDFAAECIALQMRIDLASELMGRALSEPEPPRAALEVALDFLKQPNSCRALCRYDD